MSLVRRLSDKLMFVDGCAKDMLVVSNIAINAIVNEMRIMTAVFFNNHRLE